MLTEERYEIIMRLLDEKKSITVSELKDYLEASESTIRRDITALDRAGKLTKVFGGAVANDYTVTTHEPTMEQKQQVNLEEKTRIGRYAASLIEPDDFVYLDAGTTTGQMLDYITEKKATYITNAVSHAEKLAADGFQVLLVGGTLKSSTGAIVGSLALKMISDFHFTKGFFGTNGITMREGCTTPDIAEALIKEAAFRQCGTGLILADSTKFDSVSSVTFAPFENARILTEAVPERYRSCQNIILA
ncbi:MAG: DeoR/GlpR family DNA-binding transcription regulator [Eubacteriales bacterium]|jgi:DeoR family fructose operon transcriptional repressor